MQYGKILLFLILSFGLSIFGSFIPGWFLDADSLFLPFSKMLMYCWGPAAAAIIVHKFIYGGSMARYGWNRKHYSFRWILGTIFLPLLVVAGTVAYTFLFGGVLHIPGFGEVIFGGEGFVGRYMDAQTEFGHSWWNEVQMPPEGWMLAGILLVLGIVAGTTFNLLFNVGEEVGWRGFMLVETKSMGFWGSNFFIGSVWGLWFLPLAALMGDEGSLAYGLISKSSVDLFPILQFMAYYICMAPLLAYFSIKSRSIYASATINGVMSWVGGLAGFFIVDAHPIFAGTHGLTGLMTIITILGVILYLDKDFVKNYDKWVY
ncbi:type II CAAX prenyl endopeptidase Rce1 family protein [Pontibacter sp. G13]|uniref:CPBP family glutamic-type intramembrane protease n=1 Tax=Pontibacter sp. G13 TaxID=3074898 RepID=UPI00288962B3|nr:CPBP family glutamic-type intramembrane protease [Pontibacter sp. G13]WNJ16061.1 hypothetical protein RJD25_14455 [Pontibacter sp. G13]